MAGDFVTRPDGLTQDDDRFLARLARGIAARGLTAPAVLALECLRPAAFLGGQAMRFLSPLVPLVASGEDWDRLAQLLEVRGSVERLLSHLEALPEALAGRDGGLEPGRQAYAVVDCGSTTTKAVLLARVGGRYRLVGRAEAPTTVEAPLEKVFPASDRARDVRDALDKGEMRAHGLQRMVQAEPELGKCGQLGAPHVLLRDGPRALRLDGHALQRRAVVRMELGRKHERRRGHGAPVLLVHDSAA